MSSLPAEGIVSSRLIEDGWKFWNNKYFVLEAVGTSHAGHRIGQCLTSGALVPKLGATWWSKRWVRLFATHLLGFLWKQRRALIWTLWKPPMRTVKGIYIETVLAVLWCLHGCSHLPYFPFMAKQEKTCLKKGIPVPPCTRKMQLNSCLSVPHLPPPWITELCRTEAIGIRTERTRGQSPEYPICHRRAL